MELMLRLCRPRPLSVTIATLLLGSLLLLTSGCGSKKSGGFAPPPAEPPPGFPAPQDVPIDQQLVADARDELQRLMQAKMAFDRVHAIEGLRYVEGEKAAEQIIAALKMESAPVQFAALMAVGDLKLAEARPHVTPLINAADLRVQVAARYALHRLGDTTRSHDLEGFALTRDPRSPDTEAAAARVRGATAMVLGRLGEPSAKNVLLRLRADQDAGVRQQAEEALFLLDESRGRDAILGMTVSAKPEDVMFAMRALAQKKDPSLQQYARTRLSDANDPQDELRELDIALAAALAMGNMRSDDGYGVALIGMKDKNPQLGPRRRALAAATWGAIGRPDAQPYLAELLKDPEPEVRAAAATAILQIAKDPKKFNRAGKIVG